MPVRTRARGRRLPKSLYLIQTSAVPRARGRNIGNSHLGKIDKGGPARVWAALTRALRVDV